MGNLTLLQNATQSANLAQYGYDALNRLQQTKDGPTGTPIETYGYDATGNRQSVLNAGITKTYTYPATSHRLSSVAGVARTYDAAGSTTGLSTGRGFAYNDAGRMELVTQGAVVEAHYAYNGKGEQVRRWQGTDSAYFVYDEAGHLLGEYTSDGSPKQQVLWFGDLPVGVLAGSGAGQQLHYIEPDHLGTPRVVIDGARNVPIWTWAITGEAFGNTLPNQDPDADGTAFVFDLRFPGQRYDSATGLNYNMRRDYEPGIGRYLQSDPTGLGDGPATYAYVGSAPVGFADPSGKSRRAAASSYPSSYIEVARQEAIEKLQRCNIGDCAPNNPYKISGAEFQQIIQKVVSADISYNPDEQVCGWSVPNYDPNEVGLGATLLIRGKCCPLASVIAHEAAHLVFGHPLDTHQQTMNEGKARFIQEQCFGCSRAFH